MGDFRADIKIEMTLLGETYRQEWWINYFPNSDGIDSRVLEWFCSVWEKAQLKYAAIEADNEVAAIERHERAELARLKAKYECQKQQT